MELEGSVSQIDLIESLIRLTDDGFTGAVRFEQDGVIKILYFREGSVVSASTNDRADGFDELLVKSGKINRDHVKQALTRRDEEESLGEALLGLGFITRKELNWARRAQIVGILRSVLRWTEGSYAIVHDHQPRREEGTAFPFEQIVLELIVTDRDRERVERALAGGTRVLGRTEEFALRYSRLDLNAEADRIVAKVDGERSAAEIAAEATRDEFTVYKLLMALELLGLLGETKPQVSDEVLLPGVVRDDASEPSAPTAEGLMTIEAPIAELPDAAPAADLPWDEIRTFDETGTDPSNELESATGLGEDESWDRIRPDESNPSFDVGSTAEEPESLEWEVGDESPRDAADSSRDLDVPLERTPSIFSERSEGIAGVPWSIIGVAVALLLLGGGWWSYGRWKEGRASNLPAEEPRGASVVLPPMPRVEGDEPSQTPGTAEPQVTGAAEGKPVPAPKKPTGTASKTPVAAPKRTIPAPEKRPQPEAPDPLRERYDTMAKDYARRADPSSFAIQFELVCQTSSVTLAINEGGTRVWFIPVTYGGRACYRMFWGRYESEALATAGIAEIPPRLRGGGTPRVVRVGEVVNR